MRKPQAEYETAEVISSDGLVEEKTFGKLKFGSKRCIEDEESFMYRNFPLIIENWNISVLNALISHQCNISINMKRDSNTGLG